MVCELANQRAKLAATVNNEAARHLTLGNAVTAVKQLISDAPLTHDRTMFITVNKETEQTR